MGDRKLFVQLLPAFILVALVAAAVGIGVFVKRAQDDLHHRAVQSLESQALLIRGIVRGSNQELDEADLRALFAQLSAESPNEFAFYTREGGMLVSSRGTPADETAPEVLQAASRRRGVAFRSRGAGEGTWCSSPCRCPVRAGTWA